MADPKNMGPDADFTSQAWEAASPVDREIGRPKPDTTPPQPATKDQKQAGQDLGGPKDAPPQKANTREYGQVEGDQS